MDGLNTASGQAPLEHAPEREQAEQHANQSKDNPHVQMSQMLNAYDTCVAGEMGAQQHEAGQTVVEKQNHDDEETICIQDLAEPACNATVAKSATREREDLIMTERPGQNVVGATAPTSASGPCATEAGSVPAVDAVEFGAAKADEAKSVQELSGVLWSDQEIGQSRPQTDSTIRPRERDELATYEAGRAAAKELDLERDSCNLPCLGTLES